MRHSLILPLLFSLYFLTLFLPIQARHHYHKKHKHSYYQNAHGISSSPAPLSGSSRTPDEAPNPSPIDDENYHNAPEISPSPAPLSAPSNAPEISSSPSPLSAPSNAPQISPSPAPLSAPSNAPEISSSPSPLSAPSSAPTPNPFVNKNLFDVRTFGAIGDGVTDDTESFKMAWDTACQIESAVKVIFVPQSFSFIIQSTIFTGPCRGGLVLKGKVHELTSLALMEKVDGTLMPPDGPESWPKYNSKRQWLVFYRINGMSLEGSGLIDGRGEKWWDLPCKPHKGPHGQTSPGPCDSPVAIRFFMSSNVTVQGLRIKNSPQFHFRFDGCESVHVESLHITAPALSPNTDGIHIENTNDVKIYNSLISNGDDCVSIGAGCHGVDIKNITCGLGHGISIGSLGKQNSRACVTNITVRDSVIKVSDNGVRIKTWQGGAGSVSGVTFSNIHMDTVKNPIIIDQFYCLSKDCANKTSAVSITNIVYRNIKGTYDIRHPPMHFACSDSVPCTNLTLSEIELLPAQGDIVLDPFCWSAYGNSETLTIPPVSCLLEGLPQSISSNDIDHC